MGAWRYAFRYEITARHLPELPEKARLIGEAEARQKLMGLYLASVGAMQIRDDASSSLAGFLNSPSVPLPSWYRMVWQEAVCPIHKWVGNGWHCRKWLNEIMEIYLLPKITSKEWD